MFVPKIAIDNKSAVGQLKAQDWTGIKSYIAPMLTNISDTIWHQDEWENHGYIDYCIHYRE